MAVFFQPHNDMEYNSNNDARQLTRQRRLRRGIRHHTSSNRNHFSIFDRHDVALLFIHVPGINATNSSVRIQDRILTVRCRHYIGKFHLHSSIRTSYLSALIVDGVLVLKAPKTQETIGSIPERITPSHVIPSEA